MLNIKKLLLVALFSIGIADIAFAQIVDGDYELRFNSTNLGLDVPLSLNDGNTIELPRGKFNLTNTVEGTIVSGRVIMYRGAMIEIAQMCTSLETEIRCIWMPDATSVEDYAKVEDPPMIVFQDAGNGKILLHVDPRINEGGPVDAINKYNAYFLK